MRFTTDIYRQKKGSGFGLGFRFSDLLATGFVHQMESVANFDKFLSVLFTGYVTRIPLVKGAQYRQTA